MLHLNPIQDRHFGGLLKNGERWGQNDPFTKMKLGRVMPYLKMIQKIYKSRDTPLAFC